MAVQLHKFIPDGELHDPKGFAGANNGDAVWKNEKGVLQWLDREILPSALNFVDASVAPPTTNTGDIYVLSSGGSVDAGWGGVSLDDWVRYDGTDWNAITPTKSRVCYDETADVLMAYDGTDWNTVGTDTNILNTNSLTLLGDYTHDLDSNTLTFENGTFTIGGSGTTDATVAFSVKDSGATNHMEVRDSGQIGLGGAYASDSSQAFRNPNNEVYISKWFSNAGSRIAEMIDNGQFLIYGNGSAYNHYWGYQSGVSFYNLRTPTGTNSVRFATNATGYYANRFHIGGTTTSNAAAILELTSTTAGLLLPRMTATQAGAIVSTPNGLVVYVTSTDATFTSVGFWGYEAGAWVKL